MSTRFRLVALLLCCLAWLNATAALAADALPNVVYILADDLGYGDVAFQNRQSKIPTPNLDRLAAQGMCFSDAHDPTALCTPTRYGILTGRYCWRSSLKKGVLGGYSPPLIEPGRLTVPAMLKQRGYATACFGKWHLGMDWPTIDGKPLAGDVAAAERQIDFSKPVDRGPLAYGFDSFFGIAASLDMPPYVFIENDRAVAIPTARQPHVGYVREGPKDPKFTLEGVLPTLTEKAVKYIGDQALQHDHPFFLYFASNAPHTPVAPTAEFAGKSQAGDYGDYVAELDAEVGSILDALDVLQLSEHTLVIFTSDNGPEITAYPRAREFHHYSMGELRGVKRDTWEGGHRVPFIARWPGKIPAGAQSQEIICHTDLMATLAAIIDYKLPADAGEDSYNILPALRSDKLDHPIREATVHHSGNGHFAIRQGNWVLIDWPTGDDNKEPDWFKQERGYQPHSFPGELYDLSQDQSERHNLFGENPEKVKSLKELLERYKLTGRSAPLSH